MKPPQLSSLDLRETASEAAVERVWNRLDESIGQREPTTNSRLPFAVAVVAATFAVGVWVGTGLRPAEPRLAEMNAEPRVVAEPASMQAPLYPVERRSVSSENSLLRQLRGSLQAPSRSIEESTANRAARLPKTYAPSQRRSLTAEDGATDLDPLELERLGLERLDSESMDPAELSLTDPLRLTDPLALTPSVEPPSVDGGGGDGPESEMASDLPVVSGDGAAAARIEARKPPRWQRLANGGEYEAALFEIQQAGGFERALALANAEQLMLLADVARATGQRQRALSALRRILAEFRTSQTAPLAAFSLGNMLERAGDAHGSAAAFAVYRALSPRGDFAEDTLLRELRSAVQRGQLSRARELLAQYESDFPDGRHQDEVAGLRGRVLGGAGAMDAGTAKPPPKPAQPDDGSGDARSADAGAAEEAPSDDGSSTE